MVYAIISELWGVEKMGKIRATIQKCVSYVIKNWPAMIARGIPGIFIIYTCLSSLFGIRNTLNFWSIIFPAFMIQTYIIHQLPRLIGAIFFVSFAICFFFPCIEITVWNTGKQSPWFVIVGFAIDIIGLLFSFFTGFLKIPKYTILLLIFAELLLVASQIINLLYWDKCPNLHRKLF